MTDRPASVESQGAQAAPAPDAAPDIIYLPDERQQRKKVTSGSARRRRRNLEQFRTDDAERAALHEQLRVTGLSLGQFVMRLARIEGGKFSRPRRRGRASVDTVALTQAIVAFNRAGNNQNQIARALNELAVVAHEQSAARLENQVEALAEAIRGLPVLFEEPLAAVMAALNRGDPEA